MRRNSFLENLLCAALLGWAIGTILRHWRERRQQAAAMRRSAQPPSIPQPPVIQKQRRQNALPPHVWN